MTSDQEAVCGTCGHDEDDHGPICSVCYAAVGGLACQFYSTIPAPVVPSDDAPRREQYATSDEYRAAMVEWALSAPPTPSQDAEGGGLLVRDLLDLFAGQVAVHKHMWARLGGQPWWDCPQCREQAALVESAIRADYEARLTTAKLAFARNEIHTIDEVFRMLESLGGRK